MKRTASLSFVSLTILAASGCATEISPSSDISLTGGSFSTGGDLATGGSITGGTVSGTGGLATGGLATTGGAASGGAPSTGGVIATGGATGGSDATGGTGGSTGGTGGTGGSTGGTGGSSSDTSCQNGTTAATATPTVLTWAAQNGTYAAEATLSSSPYTITVGASASKDPYLAAIMSSWAAVGRQCIDVSAFTGVEFDLTASLSGGKSLYLKAMQSDAYPSGSCSSADELAGNCYANPTYKLTTTGHVQVPFTSFAKPGWGVDAPFNGEEVLGFLWVTDDRTAGSSFSISNLHLY